MSRLIRIIANPISGRRSSQPLREALAAALQSRGIPAEIRLTEGPGHAASLATVNDSEHAGVVVVGGDGTIRSAIEGLAGRDTPMAILPTGTENLSAKFFGFRPDPLGIAEIVARGRTRRVDLGRVNGRPFLAVAGFGFDAEAVRRLELVRRGHISYLTYFVPLLQSFTRHRFPEFIVEADGETCFEGPGMVFVGNIPRYAIGLRVLRDARCDDGRLDVCIFRCRTRLQLICHAWRTVWGRHVGSPSVVYRQARRVRVRVQASTPFEMDGDDAGDVPPADGVEVAVEPSALRLFDSR